MAILRSMLLLTLAAGCAAPGLAEETPRPALVRSLIEQLDADELAARVRAERRLIELGPDVLPLLPPPELTPSVSVREAVRRVRVRLERDVARDSIRASKFTLEPGQMLARVVEEMTRQTANSVRIEVPAKLSQRPVECTCAEEPFWKCLDRLVGELDLSYRFDPATRFLVITPPTDEKPRLAVAYSGPFRIAAIAAGVRPVFGDDQRLLRLRLSLTSEPRLRPLFVTFAASHVAAYAVAQNATRELEPLTPKAHYELPLASGGPAELRFDYRLGTGEALAMVNLRGKLQVQTAAGTAEIRIRDAAKAQGVARRRGGVTVRLQKVEFPEPGRTTIAAVVSYDRGGIAFESHRTWIHHNRVWLETAGGGRIAPKRFETQGQGDGAVAVEYEFVGLGDAAAVDFVYEAPTMIIDVPVEFELASIPVAAG